MHRRSFLKSAAASALACAALPALSSPEGHVPVIDTHIHLFDPRRTGGVPWPEKTDALLYKPALPARYESLSKPHGIVGAIAVECSPWLIDNFWLQQVVEQNPIMLGYVGDLLPEAPEFAATLDHLERSPFFFGIRYGNLWNRDLYAAADNTAFVEGLRLLAQSGRVLETANPDAKLLEAVVKISDAVPDLRIVVDHLPNAVIPTDAGGRAKYDRTLKELASRPLVFVKGSEIIRRMDGKISKEMKPYKPGLDELWEMFGEERLIFGSDWPNSDTVASYSEVFTVAQEYIKTRSPEAQQKYFWKNSLSVYKWKPRDSAQKKLMDA